MTSWFSARRTRTLTSLHFYLRNILTFYLNSSGVWSRGTEIVRHDHDNGAFVEFDSFRDDVLALKCSLVCNSHGFQCSADLNLGSALLSEQP